MEIRKLIQFGGNSYVISLPKKWVENNALKKGDPIYLKYDKDAIILKNDNVRQTEKEMDVEIKLEPKTKVKTIKRKLFNAYVNGGTKITFFSKEINRFSDAINEISEKYIALEVLEQTNNKIIMKTYINTEELKIETFIRRIDNTIRSMISDLKDCFENSEINIKETVSSINQREESIDKVKRLIYRVIKERIKNPSLQKFESPLELLKGWDAIKSLEKISNQIRYVASLVMQELKLEKNLKGFCKNLEKIRDLFNEVMNCYYKEDFSKSDELSEKISSTRKEILKNFYNQGVEKKQIILNLVEQMRDLNRLSH